jgi:GNAT superfamily N-acetyltransferase
MSAEFQSLAPLDSPDRIAGYFTPCEHGLAPGTTPDEARKHIPRYPVVSAPLIGRLAISTALQGQRLGSMLLAEALRKTYENRSIVGSSMVVVDAIDERAVRFYQAHGFIKLPESMRLVLPIRSIAKIVSDTK